MLRFEAQPTTDKDSRSFRIRLVLRNEGPDPAIVFNPTLSFGTGLSQAIFFAKKETGRRSIESSETEKAALSSIWTLLDSETPPENLMKILKHGESLTFDDEFVVKDFGGLYSPSGAYFGSRNHMKPILGPPTQMRLLFEFGLSANDPDMLDRLSVKWRRFGKLSLGQNGKYAVVSESIKIRFWDSLEPF